MILTIWNDINIDYIFWPHILNYVIYVIIQHHDSDTPSVKRWRRRPVWMQREPERAHTHVTHRMRVRTQITWTWLCTKGKKRYKLFAFSHKPLVSCLRPSMCSYDGELFNLDFSVHVLFPSYRDSDLYLPLYDWQTRTVWPKNIKLDLLKKKRHLHLGCPWGKLIDTKF